MTRYNDVRPEDGLKEGSGRLVHNRHRLRATDPDLVGTVKLDGRPIILRGWIIAHDDDSSHIRLEAGR